jgi:DNA adenine methylase
MKQILKYPGSKYKSADWIIRQFPEHHSYLEPFFGSGAILFNKERSDIETINDLDGEVINLFRQIKEAPQAIAEEIYFRPYSREIYNKAFEKEPENDFERAINFIIRSNMGHGYRTNGKKVGWKCDVQGRERAYAARDWAELPGIIKEAAERLKGVQIENRPAVELIQKYNFEDVLIYADPPYLLSTRAGKQYRHEMTEQDHEELLKALIGHKGPVVISGYDSEMYNDILQNWRKETKTSYAMSAKKRTEVIWCNRPEPWQQETIF